MDMRMDDWQIGTLIVASLRRAGLSDVQLHELWQSHNKAREVVAKVFSGTHMPLSMRDIGEMNLRSRVRNCLFRAGIKTIEDVCSCTENELLRLHDFGETALEEVRQALKVYGLVLKTAW